MVRSFNSSARIMSLVTTNFAHSRHGRGHDLGRCVLWKESWNRGDALLLRALNPPSNCTSEHRLLA